MAEYKDVMVFCETAQGKMAARDTELLGGGRKLADDLKQGLSAVLIGSGITNLAQEAIAFGADKVYVVDDTLLKDYQADLYLSVMEKVIKRAMPQVLILGHTAIGRDLAPRLAFRLNTAASMDCLELTIDRESRLLLQTKPIYGGNARAIFVCQSYPQIATVRAKSMASLEREETRQGKIINIDAELDASEIRTKVLEKLSEEVEGIRLEDAEVVISGGRGIGSAEGFKQLEEFAKIIKGGIGASRPPCDNGWVPSGAQIGLTGKIIAPELYIAVAISGSSQHMSGCSGSKTIVAINNNPEANVFREAQFGVVGDWKKVLPAFINKLEELMAT